MGQEYRVPVKKNLLVPGAPNPIKNLKPLSLGGDFTFLFPWVFAGKNRENPKDGKNPLDT